MKDKQMKGIKIDFALDFYSAISKYANMKIHSNYIKLSNPFFFFFFFDCKL